MVGNFARHEVNYDDVTEKKEDKILKLMQLWTRQMNMNGADIALKILEWRLEYVQKYLNLFIEYLAVSQKLGTSQSKLQECLDEMID